MFRALQQSTAATTLCTILFSQNGMHANLLIILPKTQTILKYSSIQDLKDLLPRMDAVSLIRDMLSLTFNNKSQAKFFTSLSYLCKKVTKEHTYFSFRLKKKSKTKEIRITLTDSKCLIRVLLITEKHKKTDLIFCFDCNVCCCFCRGWRPRQPESGGRALLAPTLSSNVSFKKVKLQIHFCDVF